MGDQPPRDRVTQLNHLLLLGGLLVIIIAALAWLWVWERQSRRAADERIARLERQLVLVQAPPPMDDLTRRILDQLARGELAAPLGPSDLSPVRVELAPTAGQMVSPGLAARMGVAEDKLLLIVPRSAATTRPEP